MSNFGRVPADVAEKALLASIALCLALQAWLAVVTEIHWDEFFYLSQIYAYQRGEIGSALQTFHVHLLGWLTSVPGHEVDQVVLGRLFMLLCETGTCALVFLLSRLFLSRMGALVAALTFASATYTLLYGASFRADPLAAFLMMAALVVVARGRPGVLSAVAAALLAALGTMVTVKAVLYAPAFMGVAAWRVAAAAKRRKTIIWIAGTAAVAVIALALLYAMQLGPTSHATNAGTRAGLGNAAGAQTGAGLLPRALQIWEFFHFSPAQVILLLIGAGAAASMLRRRGSRQEAFAILGCGATLLCLLFYRNAFPYFFPFIIPPAVVLAGVAVESIGLLTHFVWLVAVALIAPALAIAPAWSTRNQHVQRQVVESVHRMFPRPVAYIDRNSLIASFPKRGPFMSSWGMSGYRRGLPVFAEILRRNTVPLLIIDGPALEQAVGIRSDIGEPYRLLPPDELVLRDNFVPQWGRIWVAGKHVHTTPGGTWVPISIPGIYQVEGRDAFIDGKAIPTGTTVQLTRGRHLIRSTTAGAVTLRWGDHLYKPSVQASDAPIYAGL